MGQSLQFYQGSAAHISGKVGNLCTVLLSVYSRTCLPILTEIGSYLTDIKQEYSWHVF